MSQDQLDGMQARANGDSRLCHLSGNRREEWMKGYDSMSSHIQSAMNNARGMLQGLRELRKPQMRIATVA
jgi:hypothetical protein